MPNGPGPRQRRATKIANRSHVTPFDKLAQWNAEIMKLGTQGAVPSIVGNSLEFVKLTAANIPGVMNNPATKDLDMNGFGIIRANRLEVDSNPAGTPSVSIIGGQFATLSVKATNTALIEMEGPQNTTIRGNSQLKIETGNSGSSNDIRISPYGNLSLQSLGAGGAGNGTIVMGNSSLALMDLNGTQISLDAGTNGLQMGSDGGVTIDATANIEIETFTNIKMDANGDIEIDAGGRLDLSGNQIFIDSDGAGGVNISAATDITMDASKIDVEATTKLDLSGNNMTINSTNNLEVKAGATLDLISSANLNAIAGASNLSMSDLATVLSTKTTTFNATGVITLDAPLNATGGIRLKVGSSSSTQLALSAVSMQLISPEIKIGTSTSKVDISGETTIGDLIAQDISCNQLFTGRLVDLSNNGRFTLQDTNTGPASNKVINTDASGAGGVLFGGYDYTSTTNPIATPTIGGKNAIERVVIDLEAGSNNFNNLVANSGSVITTKGGIKILPLQTGTGGAQGSAWGASLFLGEYGFGNYPTPVVARSQSTGSGDFRPGSGNVYCNAIRQNVVYSNSNVTSQGFFSWSPGTYQGFAANSMYFNGGDVRYLIIDPRNGTNGKATVKLPAISEPMLGQAITVVRTTVSSKFANYDACVLIQSAAAPATDRINCPHSIFVDYNPFGAISIDPYDKGVDLSNNGIITALPTPYKSTEICSVTLVASQNGYFNTNLNGASDSSEITTQFVWQFISSGGPGV